MPHRVWLRVRVRLRLRLRLRVRVRVKVTWGEERDGLEAAVLGRVHLEAAQLVHLLLEHAHLVHKAHHALRRHGRGVEASGGQQGRRVEGQGRLRRVQDEQLAPAQTQQRHLGITVRPAGQETSGDERRRAETSGCPEHTRRDEFPVGTADLIANVR